MDANTLFTSTCILRDVDTDVGVVAVVEGSDAGQEHPFVEGALTIGKSRNARLKLTDPAVSRLHCELVRVPGGLHFRDLGSKNGSWVGG
ncbi:MAG TPA: FHA domain-containing protein, partial [Polyangiaceae bacterium LLY-WYZ-15_(1-7)]|nr:FHA domain-containing protein [Polyangiaceae bacterium LLY-WYZ-15_(1-7)]